MQKPLLTEIATTRDGRDITRGWMLPDMPLSPTDSLLQARGEGYEIYREVLRDNDVKTGVEQRINALIGCEWVVEPGGNKRADKKIADLLTEALANLNSSSDDKLFAKRQSMGGFDGLTQKMWYALFFGYGVGECMWMKDGGTISLEGVKVRDRRRFIFDGDFRLRLITTGNPLGELLPARKFWAFSCGADHDDEPYGIGLAHWLYWPVTFKKNLLKFGLLHAEKFASPTVAGEYPAELDRATSEADIARADEIKAKLLEAVQAVQLDSGIIYPAGMTLSMLEASRSGTLDYLELYNAMKSAVHEVLLGQTASVTGTSGKLGSEELRGAVKDEYLKADADTICGTFNNSVVRWLRDWNYPGAALPKVWRRVDGSEDLNQRSERDQRIFSFAQAAGGEYLATVYGEEYKTIPEQPEPAPGRGIEQNPLPAEPVEAGPQFAEAEERDTLAPWLQRLSREAEPLLLETTINPIRDLLDSVDSLEQFKKELLGLFPGMDKTALGNMLGNALMAAELAGRWDVQSGQ
jgi:phage gp29-like protein